MALVRIAAAGLLSTLSSFLVASGVGCGTDAVGVDECRQIERARCKAAEACGRVDDVKACQRFYRDQCLHGLALKNAPATRKVEACVETIELAGECAKQGAETAIADCAKSPTSATTLTTACDIVLSPEETAECAFLIDEEEPPPTPDSGGSADTGGTMEAGAD